LTTGSAAKQKRAPQTQRPPRITSEQRAEISLFLRRLSPDGLAPGAQQQWRPFLRKQEDAPPTAKSAQSRQQYLEARAAHKNLMLPTKMLGPTRLRQLGTPYEC